jgi:hypothetical protein
MISARRVFNTLRQLAPYALMEILLPGGTLLALGLWLYRRRTGRVPPVLMKSGALVTAWWRGGIGAR